MDNYFATILAQETSVHEPALFRFTPHQRNGNLMVLGMRSPVDRQMMMLQIAQDIQNNAGLAIIDTTGHFARQSLDFIPPHRAHDTLYFKPENKGRIVGFNPFRAVSEDDKALVNTHVLDAFIDIWRLDYDRTPLLIDTVRNTTRLVLDSDDASFLTMYAALTSDEYRKGLINRCSDPMTARIWNDLAKLPKRDRVNDIKSTMTRLRSFLSDPLLKNVLCQTNAPLDLDTVVNKRQVFIADINRRAIGSENARLLGSLLLTRLQTAMASRQSGWPFYVYIPSAREVNVGIVGRMLAERFHHAGIVAGIDQIDDLEPKQRADLLGAETVLSFRCSLRDVEHFASRLRVPRPDDNVPALTDGRFVVSEYPLYLTVPELEEHPTFNQAKQIMKRSNRRLGERKRVVEQRFNSFIRNY